MARSTYVYVVREGSRVIGAFTVKKEMEWALRTGGFELDAPIQVERYRDGCLISDVAAVTLDRPI